MLFQMDYCRRSSTRLRKFDYRICGAYFVTICTFRKGMLFGEIRNGEMELNDVGLLVVNAWNVLPKRFGCIETDAFVVMPNHIHFIVWMVNAGFADRFGVGAPLVGAPIMPDSIRNGRNGAPTRGAPTTEAKADKTLGEVVGAFKSITTVEYIHSQRSRCPANVLPKLWQRNFYERVIRDERSLFAIRQYMNDNPLNWDNDPERHTESDRNAVA